MGCTYSGSGPTMGAWFVQSHCFDHIDRNIWGGGESNINGSCGFCQIDVIAKGRETEPWPYARIVMRY